MQSILDIHRYCFKHASVVFTCNRSVETDMETNMYVGSEAWPDLTSTFCQQSIDCTKRATLANPPIIQKSAIFHSHAKVTFGFRMDSFLHYFRSPLLIMEIYRLMSLWHFTKRPGWMVFPAIWIIETKLSIVKVSWSPGQRRDGRLNEVDGAQKNMWQRQDQMQEDMPIKCVKP